MDAFPGLPRLKDPASLRVLASARAVRLPRGAVVFRDGQRCDRYFLVLEGTVRVQKVSGNGREIVLYRVEAGDACVLTTSCLLAGEPYPAEGVTETPVRAVTIPAASFHEGLAHAPGFRRFVFSCYARRLTDLILLVETVAFGRVDARLARWLLDHADESGMVHATHQALAAELGTAREVVSRRLKALERRGRVALGRGWIRITDHAGLETLLEQ